MSTSPQPENVSLPASPPPPHPDSKISPAPAKHHSHGHTERRTDSPNAGTKLVWKDQVREDQGRRPSVQFATDQAEALLRNESPKPNPKPDNSKAGRRLSSPPPPSSHTQRVSFDTFSNPDVPTWSYALRSDHKDYDYSSSGRTFLVGTDENDYSEYALKWLLEQMVDDDDMIICLRVVLKEPKSISTSESKRYKDEAEKLLKHLQETAGDRKIALVLEYAAGKVQENIMRMIELYEPNFLVVGTRGRNLNGLQGLLPGSVSKWCVQNSPIPVVVARKESKRKKAKEIRQADPNRRSYHDLLESSRGQIATNNVLAKPIHGSLTPHNAGDKSIPNLDGTPMTAANLKLLANSQTEAEAVARAIGIPTEYSASTVLKRRSSRASATSATSGGDSTEAEGLALGRQISVRSEDYDVESPSPTGPLRDEDGGYFPGDAESDGERLSPEPNSGHTVNHGMAVPEVRLQRTATDLDLANEEKS